MRPDDAAMGGYDAHTVERSVQAAMGGGGHEPTLEERIAKLERRMDALEAARASDKEVEEEREYHDQIAREREAKSQRARMRNIEDEIRRIDR